MSKHLIRVFTVFTILCLVIGFVCVGADEAVKGQDDTEKKPSVVKLIRNTFYLYTTSPLRSKYWQKLKLLINQGHAYFFPPNIDFRGSENVEVIGEAKEGSAGSAGDKMKKAATRSLEKTKSSVEETAKMAGEAVHKAAEKITSTKRTNPGDEL